MRENRTQGLDGGEDHFSNIVTCLRVTNRKVARHNIEIIGATCHLKLFMKQSKAVPYISNN